VQVLHDRFANDPNVTVIAVHASGFGDPEGYIEEHGYTFPSITKGSSIARAFDVGRYPTFVIVGPDGRVVHTHSGPMRDEVRDDFERRARAALGGSS
jgi:hypothetical protein